MIGLALLVLCSALQFLTTTARALIHRTPDHSLSLSTANQSAGASTAVSLPVNGDLSHCISTSSWTGNAESDRLLIDCKRAFGMLDLIEMSIMATKFEFRASTAKSKTDYFPMDTPRRYTYGKCTVCVAMLSEVPKSFLPQPPDWPLSDSEVTTFADIHDSGLFIRNDCLRNGQLGWADVGHEGADSLAVFAFATRSLMDRDIPRGFHPQLELGNGTTSVETA